jgi:chemotaxis methyl-accepting protein methylase/chemotaxis response regulator CheB/signal transduction histidine kinase
MSGESDHVPVLVVGIGASAGGIEALKELFTAMPSDNGMAFVVIQHLEPTHESRMADILGKCTGMKVVQAEDGIQVRPNRVYTNPAGKYLTIQAGQLVLSQQPEQAHIRMPIDFFLTSLAEDQHEGAACIILSGSSGADGTRGVRAIRGAGGMCIVQDPETAHFPAMPQSAINTGLVDHILPIALMPPALLGYAQHASAHAMNPENTETESASDDLESILKLLRVRANSDYRHYKRATIIRRIRRRMALKQIVSMVDYRKLLQENQGELTQLSRDMLIGVSSFFRDPEAFAELSKGALVPLVTGRDPNNPVRAWVPGCATGEEAYSLAMLLMEAMASADAACRIQIFATDVDDRALEVARAGVYAGSIAEVVSDDRLRRFFTKQAENYQIDKQLREAVVFSRQDLIIDPPFSRLDLISCRNLLIYIEPVIQKRILSLFGFALRAGGYLFLGKSEGISDMEELYEPVSKQKRIYRLIRSARQAAAGFPLYAGGRPVGGRERKAVLPSTAGALMQANQEVLLRHFKAGIVLLTPQGQILHFYGDTERYLGHPKGLSSLNVLDMTSGTLSVKLRRAMERAIQQNETVVIPRVPVPPAGSPSASLTVMQVPTAPGADKLLAVIFEDARKPLPKDAAIPMSAENEPLVTQLEEEVKTLRTELRSEAEDFDTATEELKAANEEVMSMNEELQSANEELEASKEELQSVNEELTTVNSQLGERLAELTDTNNDLANLLSATEIATVFLDSQLRIKRFTPRATELLNLLPADLGRPISHITQNFDGPELAAESDMMLRSLSATQKEVQTHDGRWHTMRIMPYRTLDNRIDGVVITFSDVTRLKQAEEEHRELERRMLHAQKLDSLGVLAGGIAHDFNNILTAVLGRMELALLEPAGSAHMKSHIEIARSCALQASELTEQMLAYSGKRVFNRRRVDLNEIIRDMSALLAASTSKKVSLEYRLSATLPAIKADATQLTQVILNLMINASEATADSNGSIIVATSSVHQSRHQLALSFPDSDLPDGDYVLLEVIDSGKGMDPATKAKAFDPFFTTKFAGRGLGLSVVAGIVKSHHGAVALDSTRVRGSAFRVILPADNSPSAVAEPIVETAQATPQRGGTILVIDDESSVREIATAFLERSGFIVLSAPGGTQGLEIFRNHHSEIRAVLLDVTMPGMRTEEILAELRAIRPDTVVLLCSGYSEQEIADRFVGQGMSGFIPKPFTMQALASGISRCLPETQRIIPG